MIISRAQSFFSSETSRRSQCLQQRCSTSHECQSQGSCHHDCLPDPTTTKMKNPRTTGPTGKRFFCENGHRTETRSSARGLSHLDRREDGMSSTVAVEFVVLGAMHSLRHRLAEDRCPATMPRKLRRSCAVDEPWRKQRETCLGTQGERLLLLNSKVERR